VGRKRREEKEEECVFTNTLSLSSFSLLPSPQTFEKNNKKEEVKLYFFFPFFSQHAVRVWSNIFKFSIKKTSS
jgi:hypothetical protein